MIYLSDKPYFRKLREIVKGIKKDIDEKIVPLVKKDYDQTVITDSWADSIPMSIEMLREKWDKHLNAKGIAIGFVENAHRFRFGVDVYGRSERMNNSLKAAVSQNVSLIKSIPEQYFNQVENIVLGNMRQGMRSSYIVKELSKQYGIRERHARLIARDQTTKINGELTRVNQLDQGLEYFQWVTSKDERVRHSHVKAAQEDVGYGKGIYKWSDLPIVDGQPSYPGSAIQCRCFAKPILASKVNKGK